ncbi:MAG: tungsten ABC transporter substrate-binding protein [Desulfocapsa sp.]|nr:MAG: tungsten ABC transporter substrate-binding protein [Desulfocapsa sp.]
MRKLLLTLLLLSVILPVSAFCGESIRMASTTSTQNSGLLDYLLPLFTKSSGIEVKLTIAGSGEALELGKKGLVDVVFVHAEDLEKQLVQEGFFLDREEVMYNDFVILGPADDPAGVKGTKEAADAFRKIRKSQSLFSSRGDNSGTNMRENRIWASSGKMPHHNDKWYISTGKGQAECIRLASEKHAYTITDRGTWLAMDDRKSLKLGIVLEGDPSLFNQYGVMIANPARHKGIDYRLAMNFVIWLTSQEGQQAIAAFTDSHGNALFTPNAR